MHRYGTMRLNGERSTYCGITLNVRPEYEKDFESIIGSVPSSNTYRRIITSELITRFLKNGKPVKTSDGKYFLVLKRKADGKDYLSAIYLEEYSTKFLTLV